MARYGDDTNRDRWRDDGRERSTWQDRDEDRGFFERAGDQLRSWFSDDDDRNGPGRDYQRDSQWNRNQQPNRMQQRGPSWERDQNRGWQSGDWSGGSSWDQGRSNAGRGHGRGTDGSQHRDSLWSSQDRDRNRGSGFGGFRDESDFRAQHRRNHDQSWHEANRAHSESLGYGDFSGTLGGFGNQTFGSSQDDHYRSWRDRQMSELDQDYGDFCREREQQFHSDFDSWRLKRQGNSPLAASSVGVDAQSASNAGVGTTTASVTGTGGAGSAGGAAIGMGGSMQADTTRATETTDVGSEAGSGGRSGSRSRS